MRLIGTIAHENEAARITSAMKQKGIETRCEVTFDVNTGHMSYPLWVIDEDRIDEAFRLFEEFQKSPMDARYDPVYTPPLASAEDPLKEEASAPPKKAPFTLFIIGICALVFFLNWAQENQIRQEDPHQEAVIAPIAENCLFDWPFASESLPLAQMEKGPVWRGVYSLIVSKIKGEEAPLDTGSLFFQIRQGEIWRLFTPCILHLELLHILFNMIWVWVLSRPVEQRIGVIRTALLSLFIGVVSNVAQYLMGGFLFLGYSGIVTGLAGFIWMRERTAPWEGYPLQRSTILFLALYVTAMFALQLGSFFLELFTTVTFMPVIANTAHIVGAMAGAGLGRLSFFSWRVSR